MKISGSSSAKPTGPSRGGKTSSASGFSLAAAEQGSETAEAQRLASLEGVVNVSALLALQAVEDPLQRRKRAVGRAGRLLDMLDALKIAMLDGEATPSSLDRLVRTVREERTRTEDPRLDGVLDEIETRAAVELAKLGRSRAA